MANFKFNVNTDQSVRFSNKLEKMHRSAFPSAVRGTLNKAQFDLKSNTMPKMAKKTFVNRQPNFFKGNSHFIRATGFDVKSMYSSVGFISKGYKGAINPAVNELNQQEIGGGIDRKFIPTDNSRVNNNPNKLVDPSNTSDQIEDLVNSENARGKNAKEKFIKSAIFAGKGGYLIGNRPSKLLLRVVDLIRVKGSTIAITEALYSYEENRRVKIKPTAFMKKASMETSKKMEMFYFKEAKRQFNKFRK